MLMSTVSSSERNDVQRRMRAMAQGSTDKEIKLCYVTVRVNSTIYHSLLVVGKLTDRLANISAVHIYSPKESAKTAIFAGY